MMKLVSVETVHIYTHTDISLNKLNKKIDKKVDYTIFIIV